MTEELHYRFPPASAYRLNRCLFALKSDDGFRARFLKDAAAALREHSLSDEDAAAIVRADRDGLLARGAHPYLVFMADLRLRMEREPVAFEFFQVASVDDAPLRLQPTTGSPVIPIALF